MSENRVGRHAKHVAWRKVDDQIVLLNLDTSAYYSLNGTASQIWVLIGKGFSEEAIADEISDSYQRNLKHVRKDVSALIKKMKKEHLIVSER